LSCAAGGTSDTVEMPDRAKLRVNEDIQEPKVRVIDPSGRVLGIMPTQMALRLARERGLDLVELNAKAVPPMCKMMRWS
jgi:translation initiation factor IF-3